MERTGVLSELLALAPPRPHELLELPLYAARDWLSGKVTDSSDLEGVEEPGRQRTLERGWVAIRWDGETAEVIGAFKIRPGDTLFLPAAYGGLDEFAWDPDSEVPVEDVAELGPDPWFLRLHPGSPLWAELPAKGKYPEEAEAGELSGPKETAESLIQRLLPLEGITQAEREEKISLNRRMIKDFLVKIGTSLKEDEIDDRWVKAFLRDLAAFLPEEHRWRRALEVFARHPRSLYWYVPQGYPGLILRRRGELLSIGGEEPVSLEEHSIKVEEKAKDFAARLGLDRRLTRALSSAARRHDLGKLDERFQVWLVLSAPPEGISEPPLAKSGTRLTGQALGQARERAGYPKGLRHEHQGAAALLEAGAAALEAYLVGTHHGYGRPLPQPSPDLSGYQVEEELPWLGPGRWRIAGDHGLDRLESGWLGLTTHLHREYGYWGLAFLEALLRLADQAAS